MERQVGLGALDALCITLAYIGMALGPRYIDATAVALVYEIEVVLAPLLIFAAFDEEPSTWTLAGGALLLIVLTLHEVARIRHVDPPLGRQSLEFDANLASHKTSTVLQSL